MLKLIKFLRRRDRNNRVFTICRLCGHNTVGIEGHLDTNDQFVKWICNYCNGLQFLGPKGFYFFLEELDA